MKLNSKETRNMQKFAVRTPDKNVSDILDKGFQTLGLTSDNHRLVNISVPDLRQHQDKANAYRPTSV